MGVNRYPPVPPRQSNPWRKERTVTMRVTDLVIIILVTFVIAWAIGQITAEGIDSSEVPPTTKSTQVRDVHLTNASNYAAWCGGYVQAEADEYVVAGCDR